MRRFCFTAAIAIALALSPAMGHLCELACQSAAGSPETAASGGAHCSQHEPSSTEAPDSDHCPGHLHGQTLAVSSPRDAQGASRSATQPAFELPLKLASTFSRHFSSLPQVISFRSSRLPPNQPVLRL